MLRTALPPVVPSTRDGLLLPLLDEHGRTVLRLYGATAPADLDDAVTTLMDSPYPDVLSRADTNDAAAVINWIGRHSSTLLSTVGELTAAGDHEVAHRLASWLWLLAPTRLPLAWAHRLLDTTATSAVAATAPAWQAVQCELALHWYYGAGHLEAARRCQDLDHAALHRAAARAEATAVDRDRVVTQLWRGTRRHHRARHPAWAGQCLDQLARHLRRHPDRHQDGLRLTATGELHLEAGRFGCAVSAFTQALALLDDPAVDDLPALVDTEVGLGHALLLTGADAYRVRAHWSSAATRLRTAPGDVVEPGRNEAGVGHRGGGPQAARLQYVRTLLDTPAGRIPDRHTGLSVLQRCSTDAPPPASSAPAAWR